MARTQVGKVIRQARPDDCGGRGRGRDGKKEGRGLNNNGAAREKMNVDTIRGGV